MKMKDLKEKLNAEPDTLTVIKVCIECIDKLGLPRKIEFINDKLITKPE